MFFLFCMPPQWLAFITICYTVQNFVLGALFGPNEMLETHIAPFLDQVSAFEQHQKQSAGWFLFKIGVGFFPNESSIDFLLRPPQGADINGMRRKQGEAKDQTMIKMGSEREGNEQQEEVLQLEKDVEEESDVKAKKGEVNLVEETIQPMAAPPTMPLERQTEYVIGPFRRFQF